MMECSAFNADEPQSAITFKCPLIDIRRLRRCHILIKHTDLNIKGRELSKKTSIDRDPSLNLV
jgi:hypothetical protein